MAVSRGPPEEALQSFQELAWGRRVHGDVQLRRSGVEAEGDLPAPCMLEIDELLC